MPTPLEAVVSRRPAMGAVAGASPEQRRPRGRRQRGGSGARAAATARKTLRRAREDADTASAAAAPARRFDFDTAVLLAGFAFETYNTPDTVRWERGEDGCDVALLSDTFLPNVYKGVLTVRVKAAEGLRSETELKETILTGGRSDPYVLLNVLERGSSLLTQSGFAAGAIDEGRTMDSVDVARTATMWRGGGSDRVEWGEGSSGEIVRLFVQDPASARLAIRVMDENVASEDELLGASQLELGDCVLGSSGLASWLPGASESVGTWSGKVPLVWKEKGMDWGVARQSRDLRLEGRLWLSALRP